MALTPALLPGAAGNSGEAFSNLPTAVIPLESWSFALDPEGRGESQGWFKSAKDRPAALAWREGSSHLADLTGDGGLHGRGMVLEGV